MKNFLVSLFIAGALVLAVNPVVEAKGSAQKSNVLSIGATPIPHAELLNLIKDDMAAQGITLKVVVFNDYEKANGGVMSGTLDANFFQHAPHLESNKEWAENLTSAFGVHVEPFGIYSEKWDYITDLPENAIIAIPNDPSNRGRALLLLQAKGFIMLDDDAGLTAAPSDITYNPMNFSFQEFNAAELPGSLKTVDAAAINGNYALEAGLEPMPFFIEGPESPYINIVVVHKGNEDDPRIIALKKALLSQKVKDYISEHYDGRVAAIF